HPASGARRDWDDILNVPAQLLIPTGQEPSRYRGQEMLDTLAMLQRPPCLLATGTDQGLSGEFPFGQLSSLLQMKTNEPHPRLGQGLLRLLEIPAGPSGLSNVEAARKALELNEWEQRAGPFAHFLGSWCPGDRALCFVSFFPNGLFAPGW